MNIAPFSRSFRATYYCATFPEPLMAQKYSLRLASSLSLMASFAMQISPYLVATGVMKEPKKLTGVPVRIPSPL